MDKYKIDPQALPLLPEQTDQVTQLLDGAWGHLHASGDNACYFSVHPSNAPTYTGSKPHNGDGWFVMDKHKHVKLA